MSKAIDYNSMDAALNDIKTLATKLHICSSQPAAYGNVAGLSLGFVAVASGDFTIQAGVNSGRRLTITTKTVAGTDAGTGTYAVIVDENNSRIKAVTTAPNYAMTNGGNQSVPGYDVWEIEDPT
jgi:hypothetical protein